MYNFQLINILLAKDKISEASRLLQTMGLMAERNKIRNAEFQKNLIAYDYWIKAKTTTTNVALNGYYQANYYKAKGELYTALDILNKLVYKHKQPYLEELVADIFYELNQFKPAKKFYEKALKANEHSVAANIGLGNISFLEGEDKKAAEYYQKAVTISPNNVDALSAQARFLFYTNDKAKAYDTFLKILAKDKENKSALYNLGVILANLGKIDESEKLLQKALSLDPMTEEIWLDLAKLQIVKKDYDSAAFYLKNFNSLKPNNAYYYYYLGVIFAKNDKKDEAEKCFRKALELNPNITDNIK
jgi:tetratricopeptide (TPR) repeat protein